jgi:hypothetical protein
MTTPEELYQILTARHESAITPEGIFRAAGELLCSEEINRIDHIIFYGVIAREGKFHLVNAYELSCGSHGDPWDGVTGYEELVPDLMEEAEVQDTISGMVSFLRKAHEEWASENGTSYHHKQDERSCYGRLADALEAQD